MGNIFDLLIKNGTIVDGTGNAGFKSDVAIKKDRLKILKGAGSSVPAAKVIDATGLVVAPGLIDVHSHSDLFALSEPLNEPKIMQGICTEIMGLDGIGYAPLSKKNLQMMLLHHSGLNGYPKLDYNWSSIAEYLHQFYHKTSGNVACLIPNGCLRAEAVGWEERPATAAEIKAMQDMIRQGMAEGAVGLSTGLSYVPGVYATTEELVALCQTVAECGGVYVTHVRYELGDRALDPYREAVEIVRRSGCPVHFSHYQANMLLRGQTDKMLQLVDEARANGVDLTFDNYPYDGASTALHVAIPLWAHNGGPYELLERLKDKDSRTKMRAQPLEDLIGPLEGAVISVTKTAKNRWCEGLTVAEVASRLNKDPFDAICDLLIDEDLEVAFYLTLSDINDLKPLMNHPAQMFMTDGLRLRGMPTPATYGAYPRILGQFVREEKALTVEEAIRKMTSFPAQRFGLVDRGILQDDMKADIVVFNPATISSLATFTNQKQFPIGIEYVFVNGEMVVEKGRHTGAFPGECLTIRSYAGKL